MKPISKRGGLLLGAAILASSFNANADECDDGGGLGGPGVVEINGVPYIVKFRSPPARSEAGKAAKRLEAYSISEKSRVEWKRHMGGSADVVRLHGKSRAEISQFALALANHPDIEYIVPDHVVRATSTNDSHFTSQWALHHPGTGIDAPSAWPLSEGAESIIAVLDTGYTDHPDLSGQKVNGYDFVTDVDSAEDHNGRDPDPRDEGDGGELGCGVTTTSTWHGTRVAGIAVAIRNNSQGIAGVAPLAKQMPVRVLGLGGKGQLSDVVDGIRWAAGDTTLGISPPAKKADVINLSLGYPGSCSTAMQQAIDFAVSKDVTVVTAAGNQYRSASTATPGNCKNVINVGATEQDGTMAVFALKPYSTVPSSASNWGPAVDVSAPGEYVMSTDNDGVDGPGAAVYTTFRGTSAAAPHVAGIVALMQARSRRNPEQIEYILANTTTAFPPGVCLGQKSCGTGIVNAYRAVVAAGQWPKASFTRFDTKSCPGTTYLTNTSTDPNGQSMTMHWDFGDGRTSTSSSVGIVYPMGSPNRTVTLTVTDSDGNKSKARTEIDPC